MTLSKYTKRLVVLSAQASAYDAARAMEDNHIGAVLVRDGGELVGIVTDRDLALRVVGGPLDASALPLSALITETPAVLPSTASVRDAVQLMRDRQVRRIPVVDGATLVGVVTLDDLIVERAVEGERLAEIVRAQLAQPRRLKQAGALHPTRDEHVAERAQGRHAARAAQSYGELISWVMELTHLPTREHAQVALDVVVAGIVRRIGADEARHMLAELPSIVRERHEHLAHGPDRDVTLHAIEAELVARLELPQLDARETVLRTCEALCNALSAGEISDVRGQLPSDMRTLLGVAPS